MSTTHWRWSLGMAAALTAMSCGDAGQQRLRVPLSARGVASEPFEVDGWRVSLREATVAIGPIYVCASARSTSDVCPAAVAELTASAQVDALDPSAQRLGTLAALSVTARSIGFDYALTWPTSAPQPIALDAAPGGHSAHFEGLAERDQRSFTFSADLDLTPLLRGTRAVQNVPTRVDLEAGMHCEVELDPIAWWSQVDFNALAAQPGDALRIESDTPEQTALSIAMTSNATPRFKWSPAAD